MNMSIIPWWWKLGAALAVMGALYAAYAWRISAADQRGFDRATSERAARDALAVFKRVQDNAIIGVKNDSINAIITKANNETLAPVIRTIYVDRVRVGPGVCGPTAPTQASDASGSNSADPGPRLVSEGTEADIRALTVKVEEAFATGTACQAFGKAHGFMQ